MSKLAFVIFETSLVTGFVYFIMVKLLELGFDPIIIAVVVAIFSKVIFYMIPGGIRG